MFRSAAYRWSRVGLAEGAQAGPPAVCQALIQEGLGHVLNNVFRKIVAAVSQGVILPARVVTH